MSISLSAKICVNEFIDLNPVFTDSHMFELKDKPSNTFIDLTVETDPKRLVTPHFSDSDFGSIYAIIGKFYFDNTSTSGLIVVLHRDVVAKLNFKSLSALQLIVFSCKVCSNKIAKRLSKFQTKTTDKTIAGSLKFQLYTVNILMVPNNVGNLSKDIIKLRWITQYPQQTSLPLIGLEPHKILKRKHTILMNEVSATSLKEAADSSVPQRKCIKTKSLTSILEERSASTLDIESSKSRRSTMNLREEAMSLVKGAFEHRWPHECFVKGFLSVKNRKETTVGQLAATAASMLMDPSYRITDMKDVPRYDAITEVGIDIDQVNVDEFVD